MQVLSMPDLSNEIIADEFWESETIGMTKYGYEMLEIIDRMLKPYGLEIGEYDAGMSEHVFTILKRN